MKNNIIAFLSLSLVLVSCSKKDTDKAKVLDMDARFEAFMNSNGIDSIIDLQLKGGKSLREYLDDDLTTRVAKESGFSSKEEAKAAEDKYKDDPDVKAERKKLVDLSHAKMQQIMDRALKMMDTTKVQEGK